LQMAAVLVRDQDSHHHRRGNVSSSQREVNGMRVAGIERCFGCSSRENSVGLTNPKSVTGVRHEQVFRHRRGAIKSEGLGGEQTVRRVRNPEDGT